MELTQKQKNFYNTLNKWQLTHDNMSIIDLCALIEYQTKLRCLIEADLDTPFDYDEVRYLLEDYGYDMPKDDNKILDKAFQITENLISDLENDIKIFRTFTNEEKFEHELQSNNITMEDKINLYNKVKDHDEASYDIISTYDSQNEYGEIYEKGYCLCAEDISLYDDKINLNDTDKIIINTAMKYGDVSIYIPYKYL